MFERFMKFFAFTKDDKFFLKFASSEKLKELPVEVNKRKILIDCSHAIYPKWQIKNFVIAQSRQGCEIHALYPSKFLVWSSWKVWGLGLVKFFYNKDVFLIKGMGAEKIVNVSSIDIRCWLDCMLLAKKLAARLETKQDVLDIRINGVVVGDLIYDTYLKRYRVATVAVDDPNLIRVISMAFYCSTKIKDVLEKENYAEVFLTHSVYVFFGLTARIALEKRIKVFVVQNNRGLFVQRLTASHPMQTPRFEGYGDIIKGLSVAEIETRRVEARNKIEARLSGEIDASISYMRKSAYGVSDSVEIDALREFFPGRPTALILLHCFFDSPHIYKWMLYEDFYEWVRDSLSFLEKNQINVIVKDHPNGMPGNDKIVQGLKNEFKKANFVSKSVNTKIIIKEKSPLFALTVYGTMAHELAYMGLPVINAGANPHIYFGFSKTPSTREEYKDLMLSLVEFGAAVIDRREIEDFYFCHYIANKPGFSRLFNVHVENGFNLDSTYFEILNGLATEDFVSMVLEVRAAIEETDVYENVV